jgi:uncharacterized protein YbjT (DUF2867 family)
MVGKALAAGLLKKGHKVSIGTRSPEKVWVLFFFFFYASLVKQK